MAKVKGICKNYDNCSLADKDVIQEVESTEFVCAECGKPLYEAGGKGPKPPIPPKWLKIAIAVLIIAGLATGGYFLFRSCSNSKVRITVVSSDETMGTVKGSGKYEFNKLITIKATAYDGYSFKSWDDGNTKNPRIILTKENRTYTARFEKIKPTDKPSVTPKTVTITVKSSDEKMGTVTGGGTFKLGETISIGAIAKEGFRFISWNDENKDNPREVITGRDVTFVAMFERISNKKQLSGGRTKGTKQYSFGRYEGELENGIPEGDGTMYYNCHIQIAKYYTDGPERFAEKGDYLVGNWKCGDINTGKLYNNEGVPKSDIRAKPRTRPYDLEKDEYIK